MPHLDGAHTHGGSINWRLAAVAAVIGGVVAAGGASGLIRSAEELLYWVGGIIFVASAVVSCLAIRAMRHSKGKTYIQSIHGPTARNLVVEENARMRRELADIRAMSRQVEAARTLGVSYEPGFMRFAADYMPRQHPGEVVWEAEVIKDVEG